MTARDVGGTTNRNSLSTRQADGAAMLVEVDAAAVAVLGGLNLPLENHQEYLAWDHVTHPGDSNNCISELWATCWNSLSMFIHFTLEFHIKMSFGFPPVVLGPYVRKRFGKWVQKD